jgi:hypothetical protein
MIDNRWRLFLSVLFVITGYVAFSGKAAAQTEYEPGVSVRVYSIEAGMENVPALAPNQTPNHDQMYPTLDFAGQAPWAVDVPGPKLITIATQLTCPKAGEYELRLTGAGALKLQVGDEVRGETTIHYPGEITTEVSWDKPRYLKVWIDQLVTDDSDGSLRIEWREKNQQSLEPIPADYWRSGADPTRVTSPGVKRLSNTNNPGDGKPVAGLHPGYDLATIRPSQSQPSVGSMAFMPDGRLIVGTFKPIQRTNVALPDIDSKDPDKLYDVRGATGDDASAYELVPVADGLYEPCGLCAVGDALYVSHRKAVTRLTDEDGDGYFETKHDVASGWEGWNYHQFVFGLVYLNGKLYAALSTAMAPPAWEGMGTNATNNGPMRGSILEIDLETETARVIAGGLRTPNTVSVGPENTLLYADNQGTWFPTSTLSHIQRGRFYGHFNRTNIVPMLADRFPEGGHPSSYCDQLRTPPMLFLPQNEIINSPTKAVLNEQGPFAGQMFLGEITSGGIRRVYLEKVNGQWQGALFRFTQGLECGVNRLAWGPDGALYIGGIGAGGNWAWNDTRFGLQRMTPNGKNVFEIHHVSATPTGFHVRFTKPVDPAWLADASNYTMQQWDYAPSKEYGGVKTNHEILNAVQAQPDADGQGVKLVIEGLKTGRCVYLRMQPTATDGEKIWSTEAFYTLNMIPHAEPIEPSKLNGEPIVDAGSDDVGIGLNVLPPDDGVALIARSYRGLMYYTEAEKKMPREGGATQDDLIAMDPTQGVEVSQELGDLRTAIEFGDHRLHVEWFAPGRSDGGYTEQTGNSGVYIQGRYELQVLATPADKPVSEMEPWEAGSIYRTKTPDVNASAGPGNWQCYDIWFRAARFDEQGNKAEDARITAYLNGRLIHNDVAVAEPTGTAKKLGEPIRPGETVLNGPVRLQGHHSDADANTRYRNVWVAPLKTPDYDAGPTVELFNGSDLSGWTVRGGNGEFRIDQGEIVGTALPDSPSNTFLVTEKTYADFELSYEVKSESLNSGVQVRSMVEGGFDNRSGAMSGYQVEVDPSDRAYSGGIYEERGREWLAPLIEKPYARRAWRSGQWNKVTVLARGPIIETWVNGVPAARLIDDLSPTGRIALQVHRIGPDPSRPEVRFRNVRLRELTPDAE